MMDDVYCYMVMLPNKVHEFVVPCPDGYTIYINEKLDDEAREKAYRHALEHIEFNDFEKSDADWIEADRHRERRGTC